MPNKRKGFAWRLEINGFTQATFVSCSGLKANIGIMEIQEGGSLTPHKEAGKITYDDIVLEDVKTENRDFYNWLQEIVNFQTNRGGTIGDGYKKTIELVQLDRDLITELDRYRIKSAWGNVQELGAWNNPDEDFVMNKLTIVHQGYELL
ncbi:MAG: hypothetical protein DRI84_08845 [Bacteroidetes bacterium]|nr:MAG: hypothetical protein DRI84_08845 [Bacteroidota bacterium]